MTQARLLVYDAALMAVGHSNGHITAWAKNTVRRFLEDTKAEDEWIERECFIRGSSALLMRSILVEVGSPQEKSVEEKFPAVRTALKAFVEKGEPVPEELRFAAAVSIKYWKEAAAWEERMIGPLRPTLAALKERAQARS